MFKKDKKEKKSKKETGGEKGDKGTVDLRRETKDLLVVCPDSKNWHPYFEKATTSDGYRIRLEKSEWKNMLVMCDDNAKPIVNIKPNPKPTPGTKETDARTILPDMVLVRQLVKGITKAEDYTNNLYGLGFSHTPGVNTIESVIRYLERPVLHSHLSAIKKRVGHANFPLINLSYYSNQADLPIVIKVGTAEAGYGKIRITDRGVLQDFRSCLATNNDYATAERYIENRAYDLRVQCIGEHLRVYRRTSTNWKGNVGNSVLEEVQPSEEHKRWAHEVKGEFGMDIFTVDAIHTTDEKDFILEINDSASGLAAENEEEDCGYIRDLVMKRLEESYMKKEQSKEEKQ
ncbi:hypothetical protein PROFUN_09664 [Planoprotostelium fungivorum]|uniref:ATP-grasp domain-containing protein n=1 Tax=Planoprotostelium fungivorum TaxID=1890364 RepID=A0A2P6NGI7_9EUKA|nr:hypothetical protein PROFUN_09664 [Planoprotostelium fungivorum]